MTLEQLRVFVAVAERQHVTRAAEALNIAQSAVSASIAALEGRHGAKLFNRVGRRIELTEAGGLFLAEARAVLAQSRVGRAGPLRIGRSQARRPFRLREPNHRRLLAAAPSRRFPPLPSWRRDPAVDLQHDPGGGCGARRRSGSGLRRR